MSRLARFAAWMILMWSTGAWAIPALEPLVGGLDQPLFLTHSRDGTNRKFIVEQPGRILVLQPGSSAPSVFLDIRGLVLSGGERGLLGLAFHPRYSENGRFFVNYTRQTDGATVISEYRVQPGNANAADATSQRVFLVIPQPFENHNGGMIEFGPDNNLYIGTGDGGSVNDPESRAQNVDDLLGKILRIDVDHPQSDAIPYSSPSSNPYFGNVAGRDEIFAIGFRNPFRFSFDRSTGQLYAGDVGQSAREEIDIVTAGGNYGWRVFEGTLCTGLGPASCTSLHATPPVAEYATGEFGRCAVTGGHVYRGSRRSLPFGAYIFGDFCSGEIFVLEGGATTLLTDTNLMISSFGEDEAGEIYAVDHNGSISRITTSGVANVPLRSYSLLNRGGFFLNAISTDPLSTGYTRILADSGDPLPVARAILQWREHGVLVSEMGLSASPLIQSGRTLALTSVSERTGVGITNPNPSAVNFDFNFTDANGQDFGFGSVIIPAFSQISAFLDEKPFNGGKSLQGTFTFQAGAPVAIMAIRGFTNERGDFLFSSLPVTRINTTPLTSTVFPHWALGAGWTPEFLLVNPSEVLSTGQLILTDTIGEILETVNYSIPARSSRRISVLTKSATLLTGSAQLIVTGGTLPSGAVLFRYSTGEGTLVETIDPAIAPGLRFRGYGEFSAISRTGLAVANTNSEVVRVTVELRSLTGVIQDTTQIDLPPFGQKAFFLDELPGVHAAPFFQGSVQFTSVFPIGVTLMRTRVTPRGDFLIASIPPDNLANVNSSAESFLPLFALGGGATMEFILLNSEISGPQSGDIVFFRSDGRQFSIDQ